MTSEDQNLFAPCITVEAVSANSGRTTSSIGAKKALFEMPHHETSESKMVNEAAQAEKKAAREAEEAAKKATREAAQAAKKAEREAEGAAKKATRSG